MNEGGRDEGGGDIHSEHGPDGLPRLPDHLAYGCHYEPKTHCPVCSLGAPRWAGRTCKCWGVRLSVSAACRRVTRLLPCRYRRLLRGGSSVLRGIQLQSWQAKPPRQVDRSANRTYQELKCIHPRWPADEGEEHAAGERSSHAAAMLAEPPPLPPRRCGGMDESGVRLLQSLRRPRQPPSWWGSRRAHVQLSRALWPGQGSVCAPPMGLLCWRPTAHPLHPSTPAHQLQPPSRALLASWRRAPLCRPAAHTFWSCRRCTWASSL